MKNVTFTYSKFLSFILILLAPALSMAQSNTVWTKSAGSAEADFGGKAVTDGDGNTYVFNSFSSTYKMSNSNSIESNGEEDMVLTMFNSEGTISWTKHFGGEGKDMANDIAIDGDGNVAITGAFSNTVDFGNSESLTSSGGTDAFVVKLNSKGEAMWSMAAGGSGNDQSNAIEMDSEGRIYIGGEFEGNDGFFGINPMIAIAGKDMFVARMDSEGDNIWINTFGSSDDEMMNDIAVDGEGNMYINGMMNGELILGNDTVSADLGLTFNAKINATGTMEWTEQSGNSTTKLDGETKTDAEGNLYSIGSFEGTADFGSETLVSSGKRDMVIVKQNAEGEVVWAMKAGGEANDEATSIAFDDEGNFVVGGYFEGMATFGNTTKTSAGKTDNVVTKFNANGEVEWAASSGGSLNDTVKSVNFASDGDVVATGTFEGKTSFKRDEESNGGTDQYVWKMSNDQTGIRTAATPSNLSLYPQPTNGVLKINSSEEIDNIRIFDLQGKEMMHFNNKTAVDNTLNISSLEQGIYVLNFTTENGEVINKRITKK